MFSRLRAVGVMAAIIMGLAVCVQAAGAQSLEQQVTSLRHAISWQRVRTWHWQDVAGVDRSPTIRGAARVDHSPGYLRWIERRWNRRRLHAYQLAHRHRRRLAVVASVSGSIPVLICRVFGPANCSTALAIGKRESGLSTHPYPPNPTHFGIFQLDASAIASYARGRYSTAYDQVVAAFRMFLARGWEPWTCCEG